MQERADFTAFAWIASHPWLYPLLESLHVVGIALLLGSLVVFELRVWGLGAALPVQPLARLALPLTLAGFGLAALTGLLMFASQAVEMLGNRVFVLKMTLLMVAGLNAAAFHSRGSLDRLDGVARAQTLASLGLWLAVIICGRWIAYY
ncbi:hypothetical protein [uncultured Methylibium sp.]|uniref:hypothetical protein n=1 Tax=uncultured Methylibium sp. TaxID=381093 RepID=UPI0025D277A7|nr:hypothetical protein [uncultured Methylibium sp.]